MQRFALLAAWLIAVSIQSAPDLNKTLTAGDLSLEHRTHAGTFFDVLGRRAAVFGYEHRGFEAWTYPLKILEDFRLSFSLEGYPLDVPAEDLLTSATVRPEATIFTYSHAAFRVRQIIFVPIDEPAIVMLLDVSTTLPIRISAAFRPRLRLMWPAGAMTPYVSWNEGEHVYVLTEESRRFAGVIGSPSGQDVSLMPYQEEPRDVPIRFVIEATPKQAADSYIPIVIAGSAQGADHATATWRRVLGSIRGLHDQTVAHYRALAARTTTIDTPMDQVDAAFAWAKVGIDKGLVTNPLLGTGLVAGFRTSGESERPGFAWFFGRDALWTVLASTSIGDFDTVRTALSFLQKFQRDDGKIPHEISQSASLIPWFTDYPYAWASADATPLYIIAHADYWRASGDLDFVKRNWESIKKAYRFTSATDTDANGLIENTSFGHGWVEGGALYPPHEEIYMQGLWVEALSSLAEMAEAMGDSSLASASRSAAERTRAAAEKTYWLSDRGFYAFATQKPRVKPGDAEPGPNRETRQKRLDQLSKKSLIDEDTVLPAVALWWGTLDDGRAQSEIDHIGSGAMATDWGARIISNRSQLYDPLSYHYGSVWPLFTGWAAMGAYRYGRPHVGYQALMATALLTEQGALGYVTELLSGDFNSAFGRSSHHQVWSEAMVVTPALRGLLGIETSAAGREIRFAPQLPADWDRVAARNVAVGGARYDLTLERAGGRDVVKITRRTGSSAPVRVTVAPALPLDAQVRAVTVNGRAAKFEVKRIGDVQRADVSADLTAPTTEIVYSYDEGTEVYVEREAPAPGAINQGLRVIRSRAGAGGLQLTIEGLGGRSYALRARSPRRLGQTAGASISEVSARDTQILISFDGPADTYVRRELTIPLLTKK